MVEPTNPFEKYATVKLDHLAKDRGENLFKKTNVSETPQVNKLKFQLMGFFESLRFSGGDFLHSKSKS